MPDCGDNGCMYAPKIGGMRTNAGCRCDNCPTCGSAIRPGRPAGHYEWCPNQDWIPPHHQKPCSVKCWKHRDCESCKRKFPWGKYVTEAS